MSPMAPGRPCRGSRTARRCPALTTASDGWCQACRPVERKLRDSSPKRREELAFYRSKAWQLCRQEVLARDPVCKLCGFAISTVGDHHPRTLRSFLDAGDRAGAADPRNSRGVCKGCHDGVSGAQGRAAQLGRTA